MDRIKTAVGVAITIVIILMVIWTIAITRYEYIVPVEGYSLMRVDRWSSEVSILKEGDLKMPQDGNPDDWPVTGKYFYWSEKP